MNVADAMTPRSEVVTATIPGTRDDVLEALQERSFSSVPVVKETEDGEEFRGLVTRDALIERPDEDQLAILTQEVPTTTVDTPIEALADLIVETGERRIPVVDGEFEGIVTVTDVVRAIAEGEADGDAAVGDLATRAINCVYAETPLPVAERELFHADVPYAVVLDDDGEACGMLTVVDVLEVARVVEGEEKTGESMASDDDEWMWESINAVGGRYLPTRNVAIPAEPVREYMTSDLITVGETQTAQEVARTMIEHDVEQVPLVSGGQLAGVVRDVDLLRAL